MNVDERIIWENKAVFIEHAGLMAHQGRVSAKKSCDVRQECINNFVDEQSQIRAQRFYLYWWERREFFRIMFHVRFFLYQVFTLNEGKLVPLTAQDYTKQTGDDFSKELYTQALPTQEIAWDQPHLQSLLDEDVLELNTIVLPPQQIIT